MDPTDQWLDYYLFSYYRGTSPCSLGSVGDILPAPYLGTERFASIYLKAVAAASFLSKPRGHRLSTAPTLWRHQCSYDRPSIRVGRFNGKADMNKDKKFYITTAIAYVNSTPHIGHALEFIQADVLARYYRLLGMPTFFLTGTDEHGTKNYQGAVKEGLKPEKFVDRNAKIFEELDKVLNVSYDRFIRTSDKEVHWPGVEKFWKRLVEAGDIYKGKYEGWYCVGHEAFLTESDLVDGKCPDHDAPPQRVEEENYLFRYSKYVPQVIELIESNKLHVVPGFRRNEILNLLRSNPGDVSFSRQKDKLPWGIPVPGDPSHVIYVWSDALVNYLTGVGYGRDEEEFKKWWPADVHVIGKDILRFHAGIWPAMLLSAGVELPKTIFVHGFVQTGGRKLSKSTGNVVDPFDLVKKYGAETLRYFLLRESPPTQDSEFTLAKFEARYNADLASGLGNLVSRVATLAEKANLQVDTPTGRPDLSNTYRIAVEDYRFNDALASIWQKISLADKAINETKPWELVESSPEQAREVLAGLVTQIRVISQELSPFLPETSEKITKIFAGPKIKSTPPLFPRLEK